MSRRKSKTKSKKKHDTRKQRGSKKPKKPEPEESDSFGSLEDFGDSFGDGFGEYSSGEEFKFEGFGENTMDTTYEMQFADSELNLRNSVGERPHVSLSKKDIIRKQKDSMKKSMEFLHVSSSQARTLLQYFQWDENKLFDHWVADSESVCSNAGVDMEEQRVSGETIEGECPICFDECAITTLSCGHGQCMECWGQFLNVHIKHRSEKIRCPGRECDKALDEQIVLELSNSKEAKKQYNDNLVSSFVKYNPFVQWCPAPDCKYALLLQELHRERNEVVTCKCGHTFCFRCGEAAHQPVSCDNAKEWNIKNNGGDDTLNMSFILTMARPCPNCKSNIEKNGGCNHMTCRKCGYHFCWQCMGKFGMGPLGDTSGYQNHNCNGYYVEDQEVKENREDFERFRHYAERHNNHSRSQRIERKLLDTSSEWRLNMQVIAGISWKSSSFYEEAIEQLLSNRNIIMNSYVLGYFRPINETHAINKNLFEHRQNELERHTEFLSGLLENKTIEFICENQIAIINATKLAFNSCSAFLEVAYAKDVNDLLRNDNVLLTNTPKTERKRKRRRKKGKK
eukprot:TRINITY_DN4173_c0_g1_i4.p1 TRINITY_DN4173_c0_g1~~TRINITY_DN4173_c0_g1_i4.p1  ORF type:complete len:566 (+),score=125.92 TRINITY_DN4173_c0_g1_i4:65-1762(+)